MNYTQQNIIKTLRYIYQKYACKVFSLSCIFSKSKVEKFIISCFYEDINMIRHQMFAFGNNQILKLKLHNVALSSHSKLRKFMNYKLI